MIVPGVEGSEMVNAPFVSVTVPLEVPFTVTVAPITGIPSSESVTLPDTLTCAKALDKLRLMMINSSKNFLMHKWFKGECTSP